jgi:glycosyltransferase involved in cell wall biosynthesis
VDHLRRAGHQVRVLTTDYRRPHPDRGIPEDPEVRRELRWYWRDHGFPAISVPERLALERHNGAVLEAGLAEVAPDVVMWWAMGGMSLSMIERVRRRGLPAVGVVGDDWMLYGPKVDAWLRLFRRALPLRPLAERVVRVPARLDLSAARWLFNSEATRRRAVEAGCPPERAELAHPGVDLALFTPRPASEWRWRLLYVGRIDERKGIDVAIEALRLLPAEARLTVLGRGDDRYLAELRALTERLGLSGRVSFDAKRRAELPDAYAQADVLVFPVRWEEPWGLVPLEAMAVGTPVVATGTGGSREYLEDGDNCVLFDRNEAARGLAGSVERLASEPGLRARLRESGLATAARYPDQAYHEAIEAALVGAVRG